MSGRVGLPPSGRCQSGLPERGATSGSSERAQGGDGQVKQEIAIAREIRARGLVAGLRSAQIAAAIHEACAPAVGTSWIRAFRLALGVSLADVAAQVRARYEAEGRPAPKFSETLLSAYESGQKRPGPEYLHYLCAVYQAEPSDLGFSDHCFCGRAHRIPTAPGAAGAGSGSGLAGPGVVGPAPAATHPVASASAGPTPSGRASAAGPPSPTEIASAAGAAAAGPDSRAVEARPDSRAADPRPDSRVAEAEDDDDVLRRMLLRLIAGGRANAGGEFFGAVDRIRRRMDDALVTGTVSATMLDQWEETSAGYGRQYMTVPPLRLLCDVLLDFGDVRRMAEQRQPLEHCERLCRLAGQLAGLAGMIMIDVGDQRMARAFFRTARTAADETGDRRLRAWVAVREAFAPLYYGAPGEVSTLARAGAGLAGRNPCAAGAMALALEARALARAAARRDDLGRRQALRRAGVLIGHAHEAYSRLPAAERGDTAFGYTERQLLFHEGDALVGLGNHQEAEKAFIRALELYAPGEVLDRSLIAFGLARCKLEAGEPEEALRISQQTLQGVPPEHKSEILLHAARTLGDCVEGRHGSLRAVREYREALISV